VRKSSGPTKAFVGGTLIDGTGRAPQENSAIVVSDDRISWIGPAPELACSDNVERIDVSGQFLVPGLIDANVHLVFHLDPEVLLRYEPGDYDELVLEAAQIALRAGITTVFDTWGPLDALRRTRDRINAGETRGSRIFFAGNIIGNGGPWSSDFAPSSYQDALNPAVAAAVNQEWERGVGSELTWMSSEDVRDAVREYIATSGIDFVKYASSAHAHARFMALSPYAQAAIVEETHAVGMTAQACGLTMEALRVAIDAGVDLLQHIGNTGQRPMPDSLLELIVDRQLPCVAMLSTERHINWMTENKPRTFGSWTTTWPHLIAVRDQNYRRLIDADANLLFATDGGILGETARTSRWYGGFLADVPDVSWHLGASHVLWQKAAIERGMKPMDALLAATRNIAQGYQKASEVGTIEPGKLADMLVLDRDPLSDPENLRRITYVVKDGVIVDRTSLPDNPVLTTRGKHPSVW
jgi:imidazolonepropionase-like amidohydrolase